MRERGQKRVARRVGAMRWAGRASFAASFAVFTLAGASPTAFAGDEQVVSIPVPRLAIQAGDVITEGVLMDQRVRVSAQGLSGLSADRSTLVGRIARRLLPAGRAVPLGATRSPNLITQGDQVTLTYREGTLTIEARGVSLTTAGIGEQVSVRSADSATVVRGRVAGPSLVAVD